MDVKLQAKLLRVLEAGVIEPLGTNRRVPVDVRIVSSTNRDLADAMRTGAFREDLYFRLNVFHIELPPLRARAVDVPALATAFLADFARELGKAPPRLDPAAAAWLAAYAWPGNVRELRNVMERAAVLARSALVDAAFVRSLMPSATSAVPSAGPAALELEPALAELERRMILDALAATGDNKVAAAKRLGIGERTLWTKLKKHGI